MTMSHLLLIKSLPAIYQMMSLSYLTLLIDKHTDTPTLVEKKSKKECWFNYPQPPIRSTKILYPLDDDVSENDVRKLNVLWKNIKQQLNDMKEGENMTFDQLLTDLNVSENDYLLAIRSSLNCPTIFWKEIPMS